MTDPLPETRPLWSFADAAAVRAWRPLHDGVMGGVSRGAVAAAEGAVRFEGEVRPENRGGFASFRIPLDGARIAGAAGIQLRVRGDGHVYKLALRAGRNAVSRQAPFETVADAWTVARVPFSALAPTWRGRPVPDAAPFVPAEVDELGVIIANAQFGPFALLVASIDAWAAG
ncbi:MAG: CIA30 family protein [Planctomycetota bacterium]